MTTGGTHIIRHFKIDAHFLSTQMGYALQERLSQLFRHQLSDITGQVLSEACPPGQSLVIDHLELDLGCIDDEKLEQEMPERCKDTLQQALKSLLQDSGQQVHVRKDTAIVVRDEQDRSYELLEYYLLNGTMPWWAGEEERLRPDNLILRLLQQATQKLVTFLFDITRSPQVRRRIVYQFSENTIRNIIAILSPAESTFIFEYSTEILRVQQREQIVQTESNDFHRAVWLFILQYLAEERGNDFNRRQFLRSNLASLGRQYNVNYQSMLQLFYNGLQAYRPTVTETGLIFFIKQLYEEDGILSNNTDQQVVQEKSLDVDDANVQYALLEYYFRHGSLPEHAPHWNAEKITALSLHFYNISPQRLRTLWLELLTEPAARRRMSALFPLDLQIKLLLSADIRATAFLEYYVSWLKETGHSGLANEYAVTVAIGELWEEIASNPQATASMWVGRQLQRWKQTMPDLAVMWISRLSASHHLQGNASVYEAARQTLQTALGEDNASAEKIYSAMDTGNNVTHLLLRDLLLYQLRTGTIPWWGKQYAHYSLDSLLLQLLALQPADAVAILRYAGSTIATAQRVYTQVHINTILKIIAVTDAAGTAAHTYRMLYRVTAAAAVWMNTLAVEWKQWLPRAIWRAWLIAGDNTFHAAAAVHETIALFTAHTGLPASAILYLWKQVLHTTAGDAPDATSFSALINDILKEVSTAEENVQELVKQWETEMLREPQWLISMVLSGYTQQQDRRDATAAKPALQWLRTFLLYGHLPPEAGVHTTLSAAWLVNRLLRWLTVFFPILLQEERKQLTTQPAVLHHLLLLLSVQDQPQPQVRELIIAWINDHTTQLQANTAAIGRKHAAPGTATSTLLADPNLLRRLRQYHTVTAEADKTALITAAADLLEYYLRHHHLPDSWEALSPVIKDELLFIALSLIHRVQPLTITKLLNRPGQQLAARLHLLSLFDTREGEQANSLQTTLAAVLEKDRQAWLLQLTNDTPHAGASLKELLKVYSRYEKPERKKYYRRLLQQKTIVQLAATDLEEDTFRTLLSDIEDTGNIGIINACNELQKYFVQLVGDSYEQQRLQLLFREYHLLLLIGDLHATSTAEYIHQFLQWLNNRETRTGRLLIQRLKEITNEEEHPEHTTTRHHTRDRNTANSIITLLQKTGTYYQRLFAVEETARNKLIVALPGSGSKDGHKAGSHEVTREEEYRHINKTVPSMENKPGKKAMTAEPEKMYIANAGLILLHPFLPFCFSQLGWLTDGEFTNVDAQHRAIHLLQYMACGQEGHPEHTLTLNKILCNYPLEEPIPYEVMLTEAEKAMADQLLTVVISRWDKMKNASTDGFRGSFLLREGALWQAEEDWWLRVEPRGFDILLQSLPWGIGLIKCSWMTNYIHIEWQYN